MLRCGADNVLMTEDYEIGLDANRSRLVYAENLCLFQILSPFAKLMSKFLAESVEKSAETEISIGNQS